MGPKYEKVTVSSNSSVFYKMLHLKTFFLQHSADQFERLLKEMCADDDGDLLIESAVKGIPKVFVVSTLVSAMPAQPFLFRNYQVSLFLVFCADSHALMFYIFSQKVLITWKPVFMKKDLHEMISFKWLVLRNKLFCWDIIFLYRQEKHIPSLNYFIGCFCKFL